MDIRILEMLDGARQATGLAVIIDVFRAFSTACYVVARGASCIIPVASLEDAYRLKREHPDWVLIGERGGVVQPGFDFGNSPYQALQADLEGRTVVHTTSAGTQGLVAAAARSDDILTGSFVNARAIVNYIRRAQPAVVSLVAMGWGGKEPADEDRLCAAYIRNELVGEPNDFAEIKRYMREESRTGSFLDLRQEASAPKEDFELCMALDRFDFVLRAVPRQDSLLCLEPVGVGGTAGGI
jgi:2-phosphosulfolactate phosphatase